MKLIYDPSLGPARVAGFMSGSGSNLTRLLELEERLKLTDKGSPFHVCVIASDCADSERCNARKIAARFHGLPVVELDIREFYRKRGLKKLGLFTSEGFQTREEWTAELWERIRPHGPNLGAFGGFEPLSNICRYMPCVNVHPGDLSVMKEGKPYLVGLHTVPIKLAILAGLKDLRTTTILATPYTQKLEMDEGPVLLISSPLPVALPMDATPEMLGRPENAERLEDLARRLQGQLKEVGDWQVFPLTIQWVAEGRFGLEEDGQVTFDGRRLDRGLRLD